MKILEKIKSKTLSFRFLIARKLIGKNAFICNVDMYIRKNAGEEVFYFGSDNSFYQFGTIDIIGAEDFWVGFTSSGEKPERIMKEKSTRPSISKAIR